MMNYLLNYKIKICRIFSSFLTIKKLLYLVKFRGNARWGLGPAPLKGTSSVPNYKSFLVF
jgi:hypothetical protein